MTSELQQKIEDIIIHNQQADDRTVVLQLKQLIQENEEFDTKSIAELVSENLRQLRTNNPQENVIKTGFQDLDKEIGGFLPGEFIVIGARPAIGKTALLVDLSLNISKETPLLYITLELSENQLTNRIIASHSEIPAHQIVHQSITPDEWEQLAKTEKEFANHQLFVLGNCNNTITSLKTHCEEQIRKNEVKVIVIDYLQLISSYQHRKYRELEVSFVCRELKNIAKKHHVCVIVSSQLNRAVENRCGIDGKRPQLGDLRESGAIEQDADKVFLLHRPEYYKIFEDSKGRTMIGITEIIVAKNRNGAITDISLRFDNKIPKFRDYDNFKNDFTFSSERLKELEEEKPF